MRATYSSNNVATDSRGNSYSVQAVDYVLQHYAAQEQAAKREYLARKKLRESLVGKVTQMDPADKEERDALIAQVLNDCEQLTTQHISDAWSSEKQYRFVRASVYHGIRVVATYCARE